MATPMKGGKEKNFRTEFKYYKNIFFFLFSVSFFRKKKSEGCPLAIAN